MKINTLFPSKYLRVSDLEGDTVVTMKSLMLEEINGEKKPVLHFREGGKGLVLNKVNTKTIATLWSEETDDWAGKQIILFPTEVDFRGEIVPAIRIRKQAPSEQDETQMSLPS